MEPEESNGAKDVNDTAIEVHDSGSEASNVRSKNCCSRNWVAITAIVIACSLLVTFVFFVLFVVLPAKERDAESVVITVSSWQDLRKYFSDQAYTVFINNLMQYKPSVDQ